MEMNAALAPVTFSDLVQLTEGILAGDRQTTAAEALAILRLPDAETLPLLGLSDRVRQHYRGNRIHVCSIANVKSGRCSEDCGFCSQSAHVKTGIREYGLVSSAEIERERQTAVTNGARALGLVAAWKGLSEGPTLEAVCQRVEQLAKAGGPRADASLGILESRRVAQRLREAGVACYNHNLETARSYFGEICSTHSYEDRLRTLSYCREVGMKLCSGGIIGLGESLEQRVELAFGIREIMPEMIPVNFFNPIEGTELVAKGQVRPLTPLECLRSLAMFRFVIPNGNIMVAGGREVNLRELQSLMFAAGASATMLGNYLTTTGRNAQQDLAMMAELGLEPTGDLD